VGFLSNIRVSILLITSIFVICIFLSLANIDSKYAFGAHPTAVRNGIVLSGMSTEPSVVHVGDNFTIHATLVRYSPYGLEIWRNGCAGPLQAAFDKNVVVEKGSICTAMISPTITIKDVSTPLIAGDIFNPSTNHFKAISAGITNATLHLEYNLIKGPENVTNGAFNRDNATLISCFQNNKMFSPCSLKFAILP
jgi:hypothetical protein